MLFKHNLSTCGRGINISAALFKQVLSTVLELFFLHWWGASIRFWAKGVCYSSQADFYLNLTPKCWDYRHGPSHSAWLVLYRSPCWYTQRYSFEGASGSNVIPRKSDCLTSVLAFLSEELTDVPWSTTVWRPLRQVSQQERKSHIRLTDTEASETSSPTCDIKQ